MNIKEIIKDPRLIHGIEAKGYKDFTPIQEEIIPMIQEGVDVIGQSQTGTGKTAAFAIPLIEKIDENLGKPQVLVVTPTRELALQVASEFKSLAKYHKKIKAIAIYGGDPIQGQIKGLKAGAQIIVGTPGRLMDHMRRRTLRFDHIHSVVVDEADEMLRMGFREDIENIFSALEDSTQRLLFSATMPKPILMITDRYLSNAKYVKIKSDSVVTDTIDQKVVTIRSNDKKDALYRILETKNPKRGLIFCNTKRMVDEITKELNNKRFPADHIHGDMKQSQRIKVLKQFNDGKLQYLVATDVAARGLDIQSVDLVVNYDLPQLEEYYVHRIGRSGRAGELGESISLVTHRDRDKFRDIESYMDKRVEHVQVPSIQTMNQSKIDAFVKELVDDIDDKNLEDYCGIIDRMEDMGYSTRKIAAALLAKNLVVQQKKERDINDPSIFKKSKRRKPKGKKYNNKGKKRRKRY
ncbi:MAG: DEAD/DEAH box helicase [Tissierellia bacterium]|nr:DEAD/DEAH box helicase [Tissierellia bacterium]